MDEREKLIDDVEKRVLDIVRGAFILLRKRKDTFTEDNKILSVEYENADEDLTIKFFSHAVSIYTGLMSKNVNGTFESALSFVFPFIVAWAIKNNVSPDEVIRILNQRFSESFERFLITSKNEYMLDDKDQLVN